MRGKRGAGTIIDRPDGRYQAQWSGGRDGSGKRIRKSKTFILRGDAEWWLREAGRSGEAPEDQTVGEYLAAWLASVRPTIAPSTWRSYADHVEHHITPMLGSVRVLSLRTRQVNALVTDRLAHVPERTGRPLSPTTVRLIITTLRTALAAGVRAHQLPDNVAVGAQVPRPTESRIEPLTEGEADRLVDAVRATWLGPLVRVLLGTGIRLGEACSLNQGDLLLAEGYIRLRTSKTRVRAVPVTDDGIEALRDALAAAPRRGKAEPVFFGPRPNRSGERDRLVGSSVSHALPRFLTAAGIERVTPHGLRHGLATLMAGRGTSLKLIADQLGHRSTRTTERYAHVVPVAQREALRAAGRPVRRR